MQDFDQDEIFKLVSNLEVFGRLVQLAHIENCPQKLEVSDRPDV